MAVGSVVELPLVAVVSWGWPWWWPVGFALLLVVVKAVVVVEVELPVVTAGSGRGVTVVVSTLVAVLMAVTADMAVSEMAFVVAVAANVIVRDGHGVNFLAAMVSAVAISWPWQ